MFDLSRARRVALLLLLAASTCVAGATYMGCSAQPPHVPREYPRVPPPPGRLENSGSFLMQNLRVRNMNILSLQIDRATFEARVADCVANGDDTMALFLTNNGDGAPPVTSFYVDDVYGAAVDHDKADEMRERILHCRAQGMRLHFWVWADDSGFQEFPMDLHREHLSRCVEMFDEYADAWCVGLELDEWLRDPSKIRELTGALQDITVRPVGVHFTRLSKWEWTIKARADLLFGQYGFGLSAEEIRAATAEVIENLEGRAHYWAWEYHKSAESAEAKALGDAAMSVDGCLGTGCGRGH